MAVQLAVVDTNILVSGLIRSAGPPGQVVDAIVGGQLAPVLCEEILAEYEDVLRRPKLQLSREAVTSLLISMRAIGVCIELRDKAPPAGLPDPADWPFMALALAMQCPVITGNARHFPARVGVRVMTAREWVDQSK